MLLDEEHVGWDDLHTETLLSMSIYRASNETNSKIKSKQHLDNFDAHCDALCCRYPGSIANDRKRQCWRGAIISLAGDFFTHLNNGLFHGDGVDLNDKIDSILEDNWKPVDTHHEETIYYITGAMLCAIGKLALARKKNAPIADALHQLKEQACTSKALAKSSLLPTARVEEREKVELTFANINFYNVMVKIESVFHHLLAKEHVH